MEKLFNEMKWEECYSRIQKEISKQFECDKHASMYATNKIMKIINQYFVFEAEK